MESIEKRLSQAEAQLEYYRRLYRELEVRIRQMEQQTKEVRTGN